MFRSNGSGAFCVGLPNGYDVSVAFGQGNYCTNRLTGAPRDQRRNACCPNAEIVVFKTGTNDAIDIKAELGTRFAPLAGTTVPYGEAGYCLSWASPEHFVLLVAAVAELPDWRQEAAPAAVAMPPADVAGSGPQQAGEVPSC